MNGRTVRGRLGNLTGMGAGAVVRGGARGAGAAAAGQRAVPARRAGTGAQGTAPGMLPPKKALTASERQRINEALPRPTDRVRGDGGATRTPPATQQPVYNAQGRPIGAIRHNPRTGESVFIPPRNAR